MTAYEQVIEQAFGRAVRNSTREFYRQYREEPDSKLAGDVWGPNCGPPGRELLLTREQAEKGFQRATRRLSDERKAQEGE